MHESTLNQTIYNFYSLVETGAVLCTYEFEYEVKVCVSCFKEATFFIENRDNLILSNTGFSSQLTSNATFQNPHWLHPTLQFQLFFSSLKLPSPSCSQCCGTVMGQVPSIWTITDIQIWFLHSPTLFLHRLVPNQPQVQNVLSNLSPNFILGTDWVLQWNDELITWCFISALISLSILYQLPVRQ